MLEGAADAGEAGAVACAAARLGAVVAARLGGDGTGTRGRWTGRSRRRNGPGHRGSRVSGARWRCGSIRQWAGGADASGNAEADLAQDAWGQALLDLAEAWAASADPERRLARADAATSGFRRLGAGVLEAWARGLAALAAASLGTPDARDAALGAESAGRAAGSQPARMYAYAALADVDEVRGAEYALLAETVAAETGLAVPRAQAVASWAAEDPARREGVAVMSADAGSASGAARG